MKKLILIILFSLNLISCVKEAPSRKMTSINIDSIMAVRALNFDSTRITAQIDSFVPQHVENVLERGYEPLEEDISTVVDKPIQKPVNKPKKQPVNKPVDKPINKPKVNTPTVTLNNKEVIIRGKEQNVVFKNGTATVLYEYKGKNVDLKPVINKLAKINYTNDHLQNIVYTVLQDSGYDVKYLDLVIVEIKRNP
jgi:hypothetical protein